MPAAMPMDPRIGLLMRDGQHVHYAFPDGYDKPAFEGSRAEVQAKLGLPDHAPAAPAESRKVAAQRCDLTKWTVTMYFQSPAWDERNGIVYRGILAHSKSEANKCVAQRAKSDGHAVGGRGRYWFVAVVADDDASG